MILFISDVHLGRGGSGVNRQVEHDLIACLRHHRDQIDRLYLLGDLFDEYIEYRHLVPKGFVRLKGLLAEWSDDGVPITYVVGNHDPWHRDYFEHELGVEVALGALNIEADGRRFFLAHGDEFGLDPPWKAWLKGWLRHPVPVWIYRTLLPGDAGFALARYVNRRFGEQEIDRDLVQHLRVHARRILEMDTADVVILGHSHHPELYAWPDGIYLNSGYWHESRTFGRLENGALQLVRWNGAREEVVQEQLIAS